VVRPAGLEPATSWFVESSAFYSRFAAKYQEITRTRCRALPETEGACRVAHLAR
jgi:hypothetical protein